ncbi:MAG: transcriptional regulator [Anaerostipes sp.]|nr:transcriptional regulator [Anaerostipes sp.]
MARPVTKAFDNPYCQARLKAAQYNEKFKSREGAAEELNIAKNTLVKYELDLCKAVPVDIIVLMADAYHAPELLNYYCSCECPIGKGRIKKIEQKNLEQITLQIANTISEAEQTKNKLMKIAEDGMVDQDEEEQMNDICQYFTKFQQMVGELGLWIDKNMK